MYGNMGRTVAWIFLHNMLIDSIKYSLTEIDLDESKLNFIGKL